MDKRITGLPRSAAESAVKKAANETGIYRFKGAGGVTITTTSPSKLNRKTVASSTKKK